MNAAIALPVIAPNLSVTDGKITTTSQQIAEHFGKRHADVIRSIKTLDCPAEFTERNFALSEFTDSTGRKLPCYQITRDGFTLLAMGFTGKEAMQWKIAYLETFNRMEAELLKQSRAAIDYTRISPAQAQTLKELAHQIVEAGIQKHGETWARLHNKFKVNSYLELPATQFEQAVQYLTDKLDEKALSKVSYFETRRFIVSFFDGREIIQKIDLDDAVFKYTDIPKLIKSTDNQFKDELLAEIAHACIERMNNRLAKQTKQISMGA